MLGTTTGLPMAGVHGGQLRDYAGGEITETYPHLPEALQERVWALINDLKKKWPGLHGEDKGPAFAFHYRQAPEAQSALGGGTGGRSISAPSGRFCPAT